MPMSSKLSNDLTQFITGEYTVTPEEYKDLEPVLCEKKVKFCYNSHTGILHFLTPTFLHESASTILSDWIALMIFQGYIIPKRVRVVNGTNANANISTHTGTQTDANTDIDIKLRGFETPYTNSVKIPDAAIYPSTGTKPSIVLEIGYTESYETLLSDITLLLEGSRGRIGCVLLVKLEPSQGSPQGIEAGFVEVHVYDPELGCRVQRMGREQLYPLPVHHAEQRIAFTWKDVLGDNMDIRLSYAEAPPPLLLDDLRHRIDENVVQHMLGY